MSASIPFLGFAEAVGELHERVESLSCAVYPDVLLAAGNLWSLSEDTGQRIPLPGSDADEVLRRALPAGLVWEKGDPGEGLPFCRYAVAMGCLEHVEGPLEELRSLLPVYARMRELGESLGASVPDPSGAVRFFLEAYGYAKAGECRAGELRVS